MVGLRWQPYIHKLLSSVHRRIRRQRRSKAPFLLADWHWGPLMAPAVGEQTVFIGCRTRSRSTVFDLACWQNCCILQRLGHRLWAAPRGRPGSTGSCFNLLNCPEGTGNGGWKEKTGIVGVMVFFSSVIMFSYSKHIQHFGPLYVGRYHVLSQHHELKCLKPPIWRVDFAPPPFMVISISLHTFMGLMLLLQRLGAFVIENTELQLLHLMMKQFKKTRFQGNTSAFWEKIMFSLSWHKNRKQWETEWCV